MNENKFRFNHSLFKQVFKDRTNGTSISEFLFNLRVKTGVKIGRETVYKWFAGASIPDSERLRALTVMLNVPMDYFFREN